MLGLLPQGGLGHDLRAAGIDSFDQAAAQFRSVREQVTRDLAELGLLLADLDAQGLENTEEFKAMKQEADALRDALQRINP